MILDAIHRIANHRESLSRQDARAVMSEVLAGRATDVQIAALLVGLIMPVRSGEVWLDSCAAFAAMVGLAVLTGLIESSMARLRLLHVPQLLVGAGVMSVLALVLVLR